MYNPCPSTLSTHTSWYVRIGNLWVFSTWLCQLCWGASGEEMWADLPSRAFSRELGAIQAANLLPSKPIDNYLSSRFALAE
jgi:hypothetical protein